MNTRILTVGLSLALIPAFGCTPKDDTSASADGPAGDDADDMKADDDGMTPDEGNDGSGGNGSGGSDGGMMDATDDGNAESESDGGVTFLTMPDGTNGGIFECDLWAQDCPEGEKCVPWASDGGTWNATRCAELGANPGQPGDECTAEGGGASGDDDCAIGSMCWDVDPETNMGTCAAQCMGDEANPICEDSDTTCSIANGGAIQLCLPICDPLLQDCVADTQACYPINDAFACAPDVSADDAGIGTPCAFINVCPPGLICLTPEGYGPDCASGDGCCGTVCDITDEAVMCPGSGQTCEAWYVEGEAPPGYEDVGACLVPA